MLYAITKTDLYPVICQNCSWYDYRPVSTSGLGSCRQRAPLESFGRDAPAMRKTDWCGQFVLSNGDAFKIADRTQFTPKKPKTSQAQVKSKQAKKTGGATK